MAHLGQSPYFNEDTVSQNAHPVTERLDFREDVRRQEHRLSSLFCLKHTVPEGLFHEWVEPAGWFVEHQQIGSGHETGDRINFCRLPLE